MAENSPEQLVRCTCITSYIFLLQLLSQVIFELSPQQRIWHRCGYLCFCFCSRYCTERGLLCIRIPAHVILYLFFKSRTLLVIQSRLGEQHSLQDVLYKTVLKGVPTALPPRSEVTRKKPPSYHTFRAVIIIPKLE